MKRFLSVLLAVLLLVSPLHSLAAFTEDEAAELDKILTRDFKAYSTLGGCVVLIENGEITYTFSYGMRTLGGDPITPETAFRVGSISKMVSAVGLMKLVEEGKAHLDDDLSDLLGFSIRSPYAPDVPITLRQLMTHTAGLGDPFLYTRATRFDAVPLPRLFDEDQLLNTFLEKAVPGKVCEYSNLGGGIMGSIIEQLSGEELDSYMRRILFDPLGIDAAAYQTALIPEDVPMCNIYRMPEKELGRELSREEPCDTSYAPMLHYNRTAGSLTITPMGLAKILLMLCEGGIYEDQRILNNSTVREMCTLQDFRGTVQCETGRGLFMNIITDYQVEGRTLYGHGGKAYGMLCAAYFDPEDRTGIVMLTNGCLADSMYHGVGKLGRFVLTHVYDALEASGYEAESPYLVEE